MIEHLEMIIEDMERLKDDVALLLKAYNISVEDNEQMRKALQFYAPKHKYDDRGDYWQIVNDEGKTARKGLEGMKDYKVEITNEQATSLKSVIERCHNNLDLALNGFSEGCISEGQLEEMTVAGVAKALYVGYEIVEEENDS